MKIHRFKLISILLLCSLLAVQVTFAFSQAENNTYLPTVFNCAGPVYPLINGDFEQGSVGWTFTNMASVESAIYGFTPRSGIRMGFLSSAVYGYYPSLQQSLTIPDGYPYISFWWAADTVCGVVSGDRCATKLTIAINDLPVKALSGQLKQPWHASIVDLSAYRGQTVLLSFVNSNYRDATKIVLDEIGFQSCP